MSNSGHSGPRLVEMETEVRRLKHEIETLKREKAELRETNSQLQHSLGGRSTRPQPVQRGLTPSNSRSPASSETDNELQRQLDTAIQQLTETRRQLKDVQDRLTVAKEVTTATQKRELLEGAVYQNVPPDSFYEELRIDPKQKHIYAKLKPTTHTGCIMLLPPANERRYIFKNIYTVSQKKFPPFNFL